MGVGVQLILSYYTYFYTYIYIYIYFFFLRERHRASARDTKTFSPSLKGASLLLVLKQTLGRWKENSPSIGRLPPKVGDSDAN